MSVFWWPTADWFVSGATTVTSPIGSSARFSARIPRLSMPSSLVTRIRGRDVQSPSGRPIRLSERRAPRWPVPGLDTGGRAVSRFRAAALEARCRQLLADAPALPAGARVADAQLLLAGAGVAALLFFVV